MGYRRLMGIRNNLRGRASEAGDSSHLVRHDGVPFRCRGSPHILSQCCHDGSRRWLMTRAVKVSRQVSVEPAGVFPKTEGGKRVSMRALRAVLWFVHSLWITCGRSLESEAD